MDEEMMQLRAFRAALDAVERVVFGTAFAKGDSDGKGKNCRIEGTENVEEIAANVSAG